MNIRKAKIADLSRIAEIYVFNNRVNYFPILSILSILNSSRIKLTNSNNKSQAILVLLTLTS